MSIPVLLKGSNGVQTVALESKLMCDRRIFITGDINAESAMDFFKQIMLLNQEDNSSPISVFINSPGGEIDNGLLIYDTVIGSEAPVRTCCCGCAYSMGALLFASGKETLLLDAVCQIRVKTKTACHY